MTPYYTDDLVTIYHGDAREILPELGRFDLVFTSPPYNLGTNPGGVFGHWRDGTMRGNEGKTAKWTGTKRAGMEYGAHSDAMPAGDYFRWQASTLHHLYHEHLTERGAIYYNHKPRVQRDGLWSPLNLVPRTVQVRQIITWARAGGTNFATTHYVPTYEWIIVIARPGFRLKSKGASGVGDVWRVTQEADSDHPAPFPIGLPARAIETTEPKTVLDPFMGSGTTLVAAKAAGIRAVGIEIDERWCKRAVERLGQESLWAA